jgi:hypothetical protein
MASRIWSLLKNTNLNLTYLRHWLREFDRSMGQPFSDKFEEVYKSIPNPGEG